jgi:hypothetical protein
VAAAVSKGSIEPNARISGESRSAMAAMPKLSGAVRGRMTINQDVVWVIFR